MRLLTRLLSLIMTICTLLPRAGVTIPAPQDGCSLLPLQTENGTLICLIGSEPADRWALVLILTLKGREASSATLTPAPGITMTRLTKDGSRLLLEGRGRSGAATSTPIPLLYLSAGEGELTLAPPADSPYIYYRATDPDMTAPTITSAPLTGITLSSRP